MSMSIARGIVSLLGMRKVKQDWIKVPENAVEALKDIGGSIDHVDSECGLDADSDDLLVGFVDGSVLFIDKPGTESEVCCVLA